MSHDGARPRPLRTVAFLTAGVLTLPALAGCGSGHDSGSPAAAQDIAPAARGELASGGTVRWAVDGTPQTLNAFQADASAATSRIAGAVLPSLFRLDERGRPQRNDDYLESAEVVDEKPRQVVVYKISKKAKWSDGRPISAVDFAAQWHALSGKNTAFWTARNAGYDRIEKITRGKHAREVRVTFRQPYADWRSLFTPLYPKQAMGSPDAFNDSTRRKLAVTAGPFTLAKFDAAHGEVTLHRDPHWWGERAKLSGIVFKTVPRGKRVAALAAGGVDVADVNTGAARRITRAAKGHGAGGPSGSGSPSATRTRKPAESAEATESAQGTASADESGKATASPKTSAKKSAPAKKQKKQADHSAATRAGLRHYTVRKSFEPAYTQLALNGSSGPLSDERVRRAVARAIDRKELAKLVLDPLGLPVKTVGSHLALAGQAAYADGSGALGKHDTSEAQALLADAGWVPGGAIKNSKADKADESDRTGDAGRAGKAGEEGSSKKTDDAADQGEESGSSGSGSQDGGSEQDGKNPRRHAGPSRRSAPSAAGHRGEQAAALSAAWTAALTAPAGRPGAEPGRYDRTAAMAGQDDRQHPGKDSAAGAYAPKGTAAPAGAGSALLAKNGKPLSLRLVLPAGPGSEALRAVGDRIAGMLAKIGIRTVTTKVADDSYFNDHIAAGQYDLALYSWPGSAYPATDARPIFAKPVPGADGSLTVEQNYTRIGTDRIDQLFDQALTELDGGKERELIKKADARIWAEAGSIPLYQRPELVAVRKDLANVGAFGFEDPRYEDIGFTKSGSNGPKGHRVHGTTGPATPASPSATADFSGGSGDGPADSSAEPGDASADASDSSDSSDSSDAAGSASGHSSDDSGQGDTASDAASDGNGQ